MEGSAYSLQMCVFRTFCFGRAAAAVFYSLLRLQDYQNRTMGTRGTEPTTPPIPPQHTHTHTLKHRERTCVHNYMYGRESKKSSPKRPPKPDPGQMRGSPYMFARNRRISIVLVCCPAWTLTAPVCGTLPSAPFLKPFQGPPVTAEAVQSVCSTHTLAF